MIDDDHLPEPAINDHVTLTYDIGPMQERNNRARDKEIKQDEEINNKDQNR